MRSGHPEPKSQTPPAAARTAKPSHTSLREHSHAELMLTSPARYGESKYRQSPLAPRFRIAATPMVSNNGTAGCASLQPICTATAIAAAMIKAALTSATLAFALGLAPTTTRLKA